ncbi:MAG: hypothetical protein Q8R38_04605 [Candidatus Omnitrophota bacterium]|nr:hypothetical protein [Candidatus Omnitrophota bacterium]
MRHFLMIVGMVAIVALFSTNAFAGNSATINVTVSIAAQASISVTGGPVDFGTMNIGAASVSTTPIVVKNNGSGGNETYSISLIDPSGWTSVITTPSTEQYRLSCAFDADGNLTWNPTNHALATSTQVSTSTKFAGDETGLHVPYNAERSLYFKIETPSSTSSTTGKIMQVVVVATVD